MMNKIFALLSVIFSLNTYAQQLPVFNQYTINPYLLNPAMVGRNEGMNVYGLYRHQWDNMPNAPQTGLISADSRLFGSNHAVGAMISFDKANLFQNFSVQATYAYHLPFNSDRTHGLSIAASAGLINQSIHFDKAVISNPNDPSITNTSINNTTYDLGVGLNYFFKGLNIGASCPQILNNRFNYKTESNQAIKYQLERNINALISYKIKFGKVSGLSLTPYLAMKYFQNAPIQYDGQLLFDVKNAFWLGAGYRSYTNVQTGGIHGTMGLRIKKAASISYNFELPMNGDQNNAFGVNHEIMIGYRIGKNKRLEALEKKVDTMGMAQRKLKKKLDESYADMDNLKLQLDSLGGLLAQTQEDLNRSKNFAKTLADKQAGMSSNTTTSVMYKKLGEVYFEKNVFSLDAQGKAQMDALINDLSGKSTNNLVYLVGNASQEGNANYNLLLSTKRSAFAKKYLLDHGVKNNIIITSVGAEDPSSDKDLPRNRRVDIFISGE